MSNLRCQDYYPPEDLDLMSKAYEKPSHAVKYDNQKPRLSKIPKEFLESDIDVMQFGANKYGWDNWKLGMDHSRLLDAALRHIHAYNAGEDLDPESGLSHLAHARVGLGFLIYYLEHNLGKDDR